MALRSSLYQANQIRLAGTWVTFDCWHHQLGHPTPKILSSLLRSHDLPVASSKSTLSCISCQYNKSHKLPFSSTSLKSTIPFGFLYADVWGPSLVSSIDGYHYYLLLVDHFTKYCWFYPLRHKSDVHSTFMQFTTMVENQFHASLKTCTQITVANSSNYDPFLLLTVLAITLLLNKMARLSVAIVMLLKQE